MSDDDPYLYPGTRVLRNKLNIRSAEELDRVERRLVRTRVVEGVPQGRFDLAHLQAIHRHLFQDVYDWAGQIRTVEISKGSDHFMPRRFVEGGMADVHARLEKRGFLKGLHADYFAREAGKIIGDVNHVHPFREGNGRTQLQYLKKLAENAGHEIDLAKLAEKNRDRWIEASRAAHNARYDDMARCIREAIREPARERTQDRSGPGRDR